MKELIEEAMEYLELESNYFIEDLIRYYENKHYLSEDQEYHLIKWVQEQRRKMPYVTQF